MKDRFLRRELMERLVQCGGVLEVLASALGVAPVAMACHPGAPEIPYLAPLVPTASVRQATQDFLGGGLGTIDELYVRIWGLNEGEYRGFMKRYLDGRPFTPPGPVGTAELTLAIRGALDHVTRELCSFGPTMAPPPAKPAVLRLAVADPSFELPEPGDVVEALAEKVPLSIARTLAAWDERHGFETLLHERPDVDRLLAPAVRLAFDDLCRDTIGEAGAADADAVAWRQGLGFGWWLGRRALDDEPTRRPDASAPADPAAARDLLVRAEGLFDIGLGLGRDLELLADAADTYRRMVEKTTPGVPSWQDFDDAVELGFCLAIAEWEQEQLPG